MLSPQVMRDPVPSKRLPVKTAHLNADVASLFAAGFVAFVPGYLSRSVAGSFDNEAIAIPAMMLTFFLWVRSVNTVRASTHVPWDAVLAFYSRSIACFFSCAGLNVVCSVLWPRFVLDGCVMGRVHFHRESDPNPCVVPGPPRSLLPTVRL